MIPRMCGWLMVAALVLVGTLRAAESTDDRIKKLEELVKAQASRIETLEKKQVQTARGSADQQVDKALERRPISASVLESSRPDICGTGLIVDAQFLYMQPTNGSFQWAGIGTGTAALGPTGVSLLGEARMQDLEYNWGPGFRAGIGYRLPHDGWDILADFSYLKVGAEDQIAVPSFEQQLASGGSSLSLVLPGPLWGDLPLNLGSVIGLGASLLGGGTLIPYESAEANADLKLMMLDLDVSRRFKVSNSLNARVFAGPRLMWLNQDFRAVFRTQDPEAGIALTSAMTSNVDFFGAGVHLGAEGEMDLGKGVSLVGKVAGSLVHGTFEHHCSETDTISEIGGPFSEAIKVSGKTEYNRVIPVAEGSLGFAWEKKMRDNLNFRVQASYEFMTLFNTPYTIIFRKNDNLAVHGLALKFKFDF
jgi:hypothetical protein